MVSQNDAKLVIAIGASFTLFTLFLIQPFMPGFVLDYQAIYILVLILSGMFGIDILRSGPLDHPRPPEDEPDCRRRRRGQ